MSREELFYLTPYLVSLILLMGIFLFAIRNPYIRGARTFAWLIGGQILTTLGSLFELISPGLETKLWWDAFQWLTAGFLVILPFLIFTTQLSEHGTRFPSLFFWFALALLGMFAALILTDSIHHLVYTNPQLSTNGPFAGLTYDVSLVMFIYLVLYVYGVNFYGIGLLIRGTVEPYHTLRQQYLIIAVGFLIPLVFSFLAVAGLEAGLQQNITPFVSTVGSLIAAWGLFRYGLFDIGPLARAQLIEDLADPVVVLDPKNRIVDINQAALAFLGKQRSGVVGRTFGIAFANWPALTNVIDNPFVEKKEISTANEGRILFLDINVSPILGQKREMIGRIIIIREITKLKTLEAKYQTLSNELEKRIQKRTEELHNAAERYRTIVENQTDLIVRWKPDGTRTFVNEAYCRYWGITYEQALAMNFLFHAPEEDRPEVEEKINRLNSGVSEVEIEVHRVVKPDGSLAWQEWTDKAIRDEWGKLVEIQSTGRDITERKKIEENLA